MSLLSVTAAQIIAWFLDTDLVPASGMLLLCFLMFVGWYGRVKPGVLAMAPIFLAFKYYFANPIHSLAVKTREITRLLIFSLALVPLGVMAETPGATPRTIRVVLDNAYAPYSFQSDEGKLQGILVDQWQAWEKETGIKAEIHAMDWDEALRRMRAGEFDVIDSIVQTAERQDYFDFTPAYTTIEASIYFRKDISGITDLASLKGFPVGVKTGDQHIDKLKANGVTTVILFQNNDAIIKAAKEHTINVFVVDDPSALYLLNKMGIEAEFRHSAPIFRDELRRAVRKGDVATLRTVSEGFAAIEPGELKQIDEKWFGRTINRYGRYLTYVGYAAGVAMLLIAALVGWNRTLRKRVLQRTAALGETEQRFRQIAENIREVFWLTTADLSNTLYISPAYEVVWGRSRESLYREPRSFFAAIHSEDRPHVIAIIERDREQGFEVEYRVVRPDGSIRWIWDRGFPIRDESGRFYRVAGIAEDITDRKLAEDRLRLVVDTIPAMVFTALPDGSVDFVNQRWLQYLGLALEDVQGWNWGPTIHPEDRARSINHWRSTIAAGQSAENELRVRRADGVYRWILGRFVPLRDESGQIIKWYGVSTDIDDRKRAEDALRRSEDRIRLIIDTIPTMAWSVRPDGIVDFLNQRWMDYTGLSLEQYVEAPTGPIHPADIPRVIERWLAQMAVGEGYDDEMRLRGADGEYRRFLVRTAPLHDEQGRIVKWYGVSIDIEDRQRAEEKLKATSEQLRALSARLQSAREEEGTRIAREIHDELGSALTSLKWDLEGMEKILSGPKPGPDLESMKKKAQTMTRLVDSTIDVVRRISAEMRPSVLDDLGLVPAIEWHAGLFRDRTGIAVDCDFPLDDVDLNQEQSTAVFRIFQEALTNVLRHSRATRVEVTMVERDDAFVLTIRDNGRGITEEEKSGQASIGLLGMRERAHLIGGEIEITGIAGEGTTVTVRIPLLAPGVHSETGN